MEVVTAYRVMHGRVLRSHRALAPARGRAELRSAHLPRRAPLHAHAAKAVVAMSSDSRRGRASRKLRSGPSLGAPPRRLAEVLMFARHLVSAHQAQLLEERARAMRFQPTRSEERLWRCLSGSKTAFAFRRQLVIGPYIADFACTKLRLVVEVDGSSHQGRRQHDTQRDRALAALGWSVLRIPEHMVFEHLEESVVLIVARATVLRG